MGSKIGTAWSGHWEQARFAPYYGDSYWTDIKNRQLWYDKLIESRTPPDAIYQSPSTLRPIENYIYLASQGVQWFNIFDVESLPLNGSTLETTRSRPLSPLAWVVCRLGPVRTTQTSMSNA